MFIVIDGIDGAGKGRQRSELVQFLSDKKLTVFTTDFPDHQGQVYQHIIHPALHEEIELSAHAWFLAFVLDQLMWKKKIEKTTKSPTRHFISDGYFSTTLAYQCKLSKVMTVEDAVLWADSFGLPKPDLIIYLDVDPEIAMKRKMKEEGHDEGLDIFERSLAKQQKLRTAFLELAEEQIWTRWAVIDGNKSIEEVSKSIINTLNKQGIFKL